jgi:hypothetical protein
LAVTERGWLVGVRYASDSPWSVAVASSKRLVVDRSLRGGAAQVPGNPRSSDMNPFLATPQLVLIFGLGLIASVALVVGVIAFWEDGFNHDSIVRLGLGILLCILTVVFAVTASAL